MALTYVRTVEFTVSRIKMLFNDDIDPNIGVGNILITSELGNVPNPEVKSVSVENEIVTITFSAMFPNIQYKITFTNTSTQPFQTINGERIVEDGNRNSAFVVSPGDEDNEIRDGMFEDISTIYETNEPTLVRDLISSMAHQMQNVSDVIKTTKSANYVSILVEDELKTRGDGPTDRLDNGGAFEILRVSNTQTSTDKSTNIEFNSTRSAQFLVREGIIVNSVLASVTGDPISLKSIDVINEKVTDDSRLSNYFNGMRIKVANSPVMQVISVSLKRGEDYTEYDIERFGYTLQNNRYDTTSASIDVNLLESEIDLSSSSITGSSGGFITPKAGDEIYISYTYKKIGRDVDPDSVNLTRVRDAVREVVPNLTNRFTLSNAPIVTSSDDIPVTGGVSFLNTQSANGRQAFTTTHPAFARELPYDILKLPTKVGEYTVNYNTGDVLIYGEDSENDGTGDISPVATYKYRQIYERDLDYTFNSDRDEVSVKSTRNIIGVEAKIEFNYEDTFAEGTDYRVLSHVEILNERVESRLVSDFKLQTEYFPVTNVFRILNETTGELYETERFNDTTITFSGRRAPRQRDISRERAIFSRVPQEVLLVADELENSGGLRIFKLNLQNNGITDRQGRYIGANFDTSVLFSENNLFVREFFYEDRLFQSVSTNLDRLETIGDYSIDYTNGVVYVVVSSSQGTNLGDITYQHKKIETTNSHIVSVDNIYRSQSSLLSNINTYTIGAITDTTVDIVGLEKVGERFINNNSSRTLLVGTYQSGEDGLTTEGEISFSSYSAIFTSDDVGRTLRVGSSSQPPVQDLTITTIINEHEVLVSSGFSYTKNGRLWAILDLSEGSDKIITLDNNIVAVKDIYTVTQLGSLPASELDGYYDSENDTVDGNKITLSSNSNLRVGDAIIVNYNSGNMFIDYRHIQDEVVISYEYGKNSLDWSISDTLSTDEQYYVTYKYGALREPLLLNFGSLTQIPQLTNFSPNLDREIYRAIVLGTLQSFLEGPTVRSIERLVEAFTDVTPEILETAFDNWVVGRDNLHLREPTYSSGQEYDLGRFTDGVVVEGSKTIEVPALSHFKLKEGTFETWIRPQWKGVANDAVITLDLTVDGYSDASKVFIGFAGANPDEIPFSISVGDENISTVGEPSNINDDVGFFIWFDEFNDRWHLRWRESTSEVHEFSGSISTEGEFHNVIRPVGSDGYEINEITDVITSTIHGIEFEAFIDSNDTGTYSMDGISFSADYVHYIFDMAEQPAANRVSLFRDGTGYLNFQVFDNRANYGLDAGFYNISKNIRGWTANSLHHIAISWKFNSVDERDEMHMFVDGEEVTNLFKYGGNPKASALFDFGDVAEEAVIGSSTRAIVGAYDGSTTAGSNLFSSESVDFSGSGVQVGDPFYLLDDTADGTGDPNFGLPYTITGVGSTTLTLDRAVTLTLGDLYYSAGAVTKTVTAPVNIQDFVVVVIDTDGNETELNGIDSENPDYAVRRGGDNTHVITIHNGVSKYDEAIIRPLGLVLKRCRERIYVYGGGYDEIRLNSAPPVSLTDVKITAVVLDRTLIDTGGGFGLVGTIIGAQLVTLLQSYFDNICQPSNQSAGRRLSVKLSGDNLNYDVAGNQVIIVGTTNSGATRETVLFSESGTITTSEYWTSIDSVTVSVIPIDATQAAGAVEIIEYLPITVSENNGDFAEVVEFSNGIIRLETYGTGGQPFILNGCTYEIDYPSYLRIRLDAQPDTFFIGSDYNGENQFDGVIDELRILDYMSEDTRIGEELGSDGRSITTDYFSLQPFTSNDNTLLLMHFNQAIDDDATFRDRYSRLYETAPSVNDEFGTAIKFSENSSYIIDNAGSIFNTDEGTLEFWLNPFDDSRGDRNYRYYVDMASFVEESLESTSSLTVTANGRIRNVISVHLATDTYKIGTNYFPGGSVSNIDYKTITLGAPLPAQNTPVVVTYVPLNNQGDRFSIFKDPNGRINFFVKASEVEHLITVPMSWERHTWHRIMVMWKMNSPDGQDRLRLFVDGDERGTVRYGTGLIYGTGVIWGQAEVRAGVNRFLVNNIDLMDTFPRITIGSDSFGLNESRVLMDNIRFSNIQRLGSIRVTTGGVVDVNYTENTEFAIPVVDDPNTTAIYDFDTTESDIEYLTTLINSERGIFRFYVNVIDSFDKLTGNDDLKELLEELINTIKPAHTECIIEYSE